MKSRQTRVKDARETKEAHHAHRHANRAVELALEVQGAIDKTGKTRKLQPIELYIFHSAVRLGTEAGDYHHESHRALASIIRKLEGFKRQLREMHKGYRLLLPAEDFAKPNEKPQLMARQATGMGWR